MIRIDEIYQNVFLPKVDKKLYHSIHWFDPFGSVDFKNLCSAPVVSSGMPYGPPKQPNHNVVRYLFWDQEPLHVNTTDDTLQQFISIFDTGRRHIVVSEYGSEYVDRIQNLYGFVPHYYFFHAWAALDWFRGYNRTHHSIAFSEKNIEKTFLCPNNIIGGQRTHRLKLFAEMVNHNLLDNNYVSFPDRCPYENKSTLELCQEYNIDLKSVKLPLIIDKKENLHLQSHCIDLWNESNQSLIQVVTETVYSGRRQHLTEKIFKPIVMQQPFIVVSCQGSLEYLRRYGFQTFGTIWDESYDEADDDLRISRIIKTLIEINNLSKKEKQQMQKHLSPIVEHNYQWFYSNEFEELLWDELSAMIKSF